MECNQGSPDQVGSSTHTKGEPEISLDDIFRMMQGQSKAMMEIAKQVQIQNDKIVRLSKATGKAIFNEEAEDFIDEDPKIETDFMGYTENPMKIGKQVC
jgi:hypothetical protein